MITNGIELNHVIRNINKQIVKYYIKEFNLDVDIEDIDDKENVLDTFAKFESKYAKNNFIYIDYPYEIFGCAETSEKKLAVKITNWLTDISNIEDEDIRIVFYSLNEEALTIQSTFFFLSKIGTRVREVFFPKKNDEIWERCDVVITANDEVLASKPNGKKTVKIKRTWNDGSESDMEYESLSSVIEDEKFFDKIVNNEKIN